MSLVLFSALATVALFGIVFGACAIVTAPPRPLPLPQRRRPWNDVATARVAANARLAELAGIARDEAEAEAERLTAEARRLRARNAELAKALAEAQAVAETLIEGGNGEGDAAARVLTLTPEPKII